VQLVQTTLPNELQAQQTLIRRLGFISLPYCVMSAAIPILKDQLLVSTYVDNIIFYKEEKWKSTIFAQISKNRPINWSTNY